MQQFLAAPVRTSAGLDDKGEFGVDAVGITLGLGLGSHLVVFVVVGERESLMASGV